MGIERILLSSTIILLLTVTGCGNGKDSLTPDNPDGNTEIEDDIPVVDSIMILYNGQNVKDTLALTLGDKVGLICSYSPQNASVSDRFVKVEGNVVALETEASTGNKDLLVTITTENVGKTSLSYHIKYLYRQDGNENVAELEKDIIITVNQRDPLDEPISFEDKTVKTICVNRWDTNNDGELSYREASAVRNIGTWIDERTITSFKEMKYFTSLDTIPDYAFLRCFSLKHINIPDNVKYIGCVSFYSCPLEMTGDTLTLPKNLEEIGNWTFNLENLHNIKTIVFDKNIKKINMIPFFTNDVNTIIFLGENPPASWNITGLGDNNSINMFETERQINIIVPKGSIDRYNKKFRKDIGNGQYIYTNNEPPKEDCDTIHVVFDDMYMDIGATNNYIICDKKTKKKLYEYNKIQFLKTINKIYDSENWLKESDEVVMKSCWTSLMGRNSHYVFSEN